MLDNALQSKIRLNENSKLDESQVLRKTIKYNKNTENTNIENDENNQNIANVQKNIKKDAKVNNENKNPLSKNCLENVKAKNKNIVKYTKRKTTIPSNNTFFQAKKNTYNPVNSITTINDSTLDKSRILNSESEIKIAPTDNNSIIKNDKNQINNILNFIQQNSTIDSSLCSVSKRNSLPFLDTDYNLLNYYLNDPEIKKNKKIKEFLNDFLNDENSPPSSDENKNQLKKARSILKKVSILNGKIKNSKFDFGNDNESDKEKENNAIDGKNNNSIKNKNSILYTKENTGIITIKLNNDISVEVDYKLYSKNLENLLINRYNQPSFTNEEYLRLYSHLIEKDIGNSILENLLNEEKSCNLKITKFLASHKVSERMRSKMVDWIIEVLINYNCDETTFFIGISIMDRYFKFYNNSIIKPEDLHLIGVTVMFMASKYQDIYPLRLKFVQENISHKKFSIEQIKTKEIDISNALLYQITFPTQWDFINIYLEEIFFNIQNDFFIKNKTLNEYYMSTTYYMQSASAKKVKFLKEDFINNGLLYDFDFTKYNSNFLNLLKHLLIYLCKMNAHDYKISYKTPSRVGASTLFVAMKISEQINEEVYICEFFCKKLIALSKCTEKKIVKLAKRILNNAQNFDQLFSNLENLKKYHYEAITDLSVTK